MAAMGNLLIKDDAASPVEYTFKPVTDRDGSPYWRTSIAGVPLEGQMRFRLTEEQLKDGNWKRTAKLEVPVMETLGASGTSAGYVAPPKVAYVETHIYTHFSNRRSTVAEAHIRLWLRCHGRRLRGCQRTGPHSLTFICGTFCQRRRIVARCLCSSGGSSKRRRASHQ